MCSVGLPIKTATPLGGSTSSINSTLRTLGRFT
jgi:hypothetical protein